MVTYVSGFGIEKEQNLIDHIGAPGERIPFEPREEWPVRADQFLEEGASEGDVDRSTADQNRVDHKPGAWMPIWSAEG